MMKYGWLTSMNPKRHQQAMNQVMRELVQVIENDELWRGRFVFRQYGNTRWAPFEDSSGAELFVRLIAIDKETGHEQISEWNSVNGWRYMNAWNIFAFANDFICDCERIRKEV